MSLIKPKNIEETIITLLQSGEKKATGLIEELTHLRKSVTRQAVYVALRNLKSAEVIVIYKGKVALNIAWIKDMTIALNKMAQSYGEKINTFDFLTLGNKESVLYSFNSLIHLDAFWGHAQSLIVEATPAAEAVYAYNPHYWFYIARPATEKKLLAAFVSQKRQFLMTVGNSSNLDKALKVNFTGDYNQYTFKRLYNRPEYYISAIGDYLIEVFLSRDTASKIERIYNENIRITNSVVDEFSELLKSKTRSKIKISRNHAKAAALKKKLAKNFYIKTAI